MNLLTSLPYGFRLLLLASVVVCLFAGIGPAETTVDDGDTVDCQCAYCRFGLPLSTGDADAIILADRWNNTATNGNTGPLGTPVTLTWSIVRDGQDFTAVGITPSDMIEFLDTQWSTDGSPTAFEGRAWFGPLKQGLERWGEVSGLSYIYEPNDSGNFGAAGVRGVRGDVRIGGFDWDGSGRVLARNFFPDGGEMTLDTAEMVALNPDSSNANRRFRNIISHENGHGIGLDHVIDDVTGATFLMNPALSQAFDGPQFHDILAAQRGYGDPQEKNGGNDTFATATSLGVISDGTSAGVGFDTPDLGGNPSGISIEQTDFVSIDDDSDTDFWRFSVDAPSTATIVLNPRGPSYGAVIQDDPQPATSEFNASEQSDLVLAIFDQNEVLLAQFDAGGLGEDENSGQILLPESGDYFVRVTGKADAAQMYSLDVSVISGLAQTDVIYSINSATSFGDNGFGSGSGPTFTANMDGTFSLANSTTSANNNAVFIDSSDGGSVETLLGRSLTTGDIVTVSGTVTSANVDYRANGIEFGLQSAPGFRAAPNMLLQIDADGGRGGFMGFLGVIAGDRTDTPGVVEASLNNGYTFVATYSESDVVYTVSNIITTNETGSEPVGASSFSFSLSDAVAADPSLSSVLDDYVANFSTFVGDSFAYFSHQNSGGGTSSTFSSFEIAVTRFESVLLCDVNQDGEVNFGDITPFIAVLQSGTFLAEADCNQDGVVDFGDIAAFIETLQSQ